MADELDAFLGGAQAPAEAPAERAAPVIPAQAGTPSAESKHAPGTERGAPTTPTEAPPRESGGKAPEAEPEDDDGEALNARDGEALVPRRAYETERRRRQDWKTKYAAEQAKLEEVRRQLEEAKRPPPAPAQPPQLAIPPLPDPQVDPVGYVQAAVWRQQQAMLNERLNLSEAMLREKIGKEKLDEYVNDFKAFAEQDQSLWQKLHQQPAPYQWLAGEVEQRRKRAEIGDDPSAFEQRLREKIMAEMAEQAGNGNGGAMPMPSLPRQPPSLATARSVAGRTQTTFTGPPSMDDILRRPDRRAH